ncbi:MAG: pirin family protein [Vicinamibacterales bacterium]
MIIRRSGEDRGRADWGWLDSRHSFSFGEYYDPSHMGFRALRVINEDRVKPGHGFGTHPHRDMEILSYVLEGALAHRDSMGTGSVIRPGDVQRMSAGTGVLHSEMNPSNDEAVHFLQIWLLPDEQGIPPEYEQKHFPLDERRGRLRLVAGKGGREGALAIHQDVDLYSSVLGAGERVRMDLRPGRHAWVQVARGEVSVNGEALRQGDGAAVTNETGLDFEAADGAEFLVFDLA